MTRAETVLWERLQKFQFEPPHAGYTFVQRLARENGWPAGFAQRAVEEYRRFAFLAVAAGHPVSPSDAVDQVWHTHLLFTRTYWGEFCEGVLGKPLHHEPSSGLDGEAERFEDWYGKTIASYRIYFGEPPCEFWPQGAAKLGATHRYCRVDLSNHWMISRRKTLAAAQMIVAAVLLVALLFFATGCEVSGGKDAFNPLELRGTAFLKFFAMAFVAAGVLAFIIRQRAKEPPEMAGPTAPEPLELTAYEMAYLAGGPSRVGAVAAASLYHRGLLKVRAGQLMRSGEGIPADVQLDLPERALWRAATQRKTLATLVRETREILEQSGERVKRVRWIVSDETAAWALWCSLAVMLTVPALGVVKICVGISRGRPVGFLVIGSVVALIVALATCVRRPLRTRTGDAALANLRRQNTKTTATLACSVDAIAVIVAMEGINALVGPEWAPLRTTSYASGDFSGGGDSGGSSCGGGGCGGGGCGGCGS